MNTGCLMVDFRLSWQWPISKNHLHENGLSTRPHCTVLYGFPEDPDIEWFKNNLKPITDYEFLVMGLNIFRNEEFDVLHYELQSIVAFEMNMLLKTQFAVDSEYQFYKPHMTIGYFNKGAADRYLPKKFNQTVIKPSNYRYSTTQDTDIIF